MSDTNESPVVVADLDDLRSAATALWARGLRSEHFAVQDAIREIARLRDQIEALP